MKQGIPISTIVLIISGIVYISSGNTVNVQNQRQLSGNELFLKSLADASPDKLADRGPAPDLTPHPEPALVGTYDPGPKPKPKPKPDPEPAPDTTSDPGPAPDTTTDPLPAPDTTTDPGPAPDTITDPVPAPDTITDPGPAPDTLTDPGPAPDTLTDPGPAPQPEPEPDPGPAPAPDTITDPAPAPDTITDPESGPDTLTDPGPAPQPEPQPEQEYKPGVKPTAEISGIDSICEGETGELLIILTGTAPWDIKIRKNDSKWKEINNIQNSNYILKANEPGTYTISTVEDFFRKGTASGSGSIRLRNEPTASLDGSAAICGDGQASLSVTLTGSSPWNLTYRVNNETPLSADITKSAGTITAKKSGTYTLMEVYDRYCKGSVSGSATVTATSAPVVTLTGLAGSYSYQSTEWISLGGSPSGGEFSGNGVLHYENKWYFLPALAQVGTNDIVYKYRASPSSCYGYDTATVRVFEATAEILFTRERTNFCLNDAPFQVSGLNISGGGTGSFYISGGTGLKDNGDNTATVYPSQLSASQYTITYTASDGTEVERTFEIGATLNADFTWETECYHPGQPIRFTNTTESPFGFLGENSYQWKIYSPGDSASWSSRDVTYSFPKPGNYKVELKVTNSNGCVDTAVRLLVLQPVVSLSGQNYFEDFEDPGEWQSTSSVSSTINSWQLGSPGKHGFPLHGFERAYSGEKCWYTDITQNPVPAEESWITSPCFDFTGTRKPTFVARVWRSFNDNGDGATLQYSIDNGRSWKPVGSLNDGINWYNSYYGNSGEQSIGWTAIKDTGWVETRHALDFLTDEAQVMFRIYYKSHGSAYGNDGIAVDDIHFVERNRNILVEHFTNSSDANSYLADSILHEVIDASGTDVIDLHYHTEEPGEDPFNEDNPMISSTRQFYYSITGVPYTILDGGSASKQRVDYLTGGLDPGYIAVESLYDSDFKLEVYSMTEGDSLYAQAVITAVNQVPLTEIAVRIAVLESVVDGITVANGSRFFRNVVKTMLPDAAGTGIYKEWAPGDWAVVTQSWGIKNVYDSSNLRVVAFLQDEITQEVYQAQLDKRALFTGTDDPGDLSEAGNNISVFPNPAREVLYINTGENEDDFTVELISSLGNTVYSAFLPVRAGLHEIPVNNLPDGMYLVRIRNQKSILGSWKVLVRK